MEPISSQRVGENWKRIGVRAILSSHWPPYCIVRWLFTNPTTRWPKNYSGQIAKQSNRQVPTCFHLISILFFIFVNTSLPTTVSCRFGFCPKHLTAAKLAPELSRHNSEEPPAIWIRNKGVIILFSDPQVRIWWRWTEQGASSKDQVQNCIQLISKQSRVNWIIIF